MIRWKNFLVGGLFTLAALGGIFALRDTAFANLFISAWTGLRLNSGLVLHYTFDGKDMIDGTHTIYTSTGFLYPGAHSGLSGYGDGNGFETTQGSGSLDVVDGFGLTDLSSGTGNATDGCGTFPQAEDDLHVFRDFNISLPAGATVDGVFVMPYASSTLTGTNIFCVALSWGAGTTTANSSGDIIDPVTYYSSGQSSSRSENWGRSWSTTDLSNANFRVYIAPDPNNSNARNFFLDALSVTVSYHYTTTDTAATVKDVSGQGNDGSVEFGSVKQGKIGQGMEFAYGKNSGVNGGSGSSITDLTQKTACAWTYPRSFGDSWDDSTIVSKISGLNGWALEYGDDFGTGLYFAQGWSGNGNSLWYTPLTASYLNQWHHVCVSYDDSSTANNPTLYIDGSPVQVSSSNAPSGTVNTDNDQSLYVGWWYPAPTGSFDGVLDDVRVYNRILSASEIKKLYLMGASMVVNSSHRSELTDGLVGYWTMDGKDIDLGQVTAEVRDASGNGNNGDWVNHATTTAIGKIGQAIDLDGTDDYVSIANESNFDFERTQPFSISAWVWRDTTTKEHDIVEKVVGGNYAGYALYVESVNQVDFSLQGVTGGAIKVFTSTTLSAGRWYHIVGTYDGSQTQAGMRIYLDGVSQSLNTSGVGLSASILNNENLLIGDDIETDGCCNFDGKIDDVRIYNRVLSPEEVKKLYYMGSSLQLNKTPRQRSTDGLVGYWTFDGKDMDWSTGQVSDVASGNTAGMVGLSTSTAPRPGKIGQGLQFDNSLTQYMTIGNVSALRFTSSFSLGVWVRTDSPVSMYSSNGTIFSKTGNSPNIGYSLEVTYDNGVPQYIFYVSSDGSTSPAPRRYSSANVATSTWQHVVAVYDAASPALHIYVDGALSDGTSGGTPPASAFNTSAAAVIGARSSTGNRFTGTLDNIRVYNRALSADEVKQLYLMGK